VSDNRRTDTAFHRVDASGTTVDPFTEKRFDGVMERWVAARREWQRQSLLLWLGTVASHFTDDELEYLRRMGLTSQMDRSNVRSARTGTPHSFIAPIPTDGRNHP
jgi:hypothetical protein